MTIRRRSRPGYATIGRAGYRARRWLGAAMKSIGAIASTLFTVVGLQACLAQPSVDWKFFGGTKDHVCLYNNTSVVHGAEGNTLVQIECLSKFDLASIDIAKDFAGTILQSTNKKAAHHYLPPVVAAIPYSDYEQMRTITLWEEIANVAHIMRRIRALPTGC